MRRIVLLILALAPAAALASLPLQATRKASCQAASRVQQQSSMAPAIRLFSLRPIQQPVLGHRSFRSAEREAHVEPLERHQLRVYPHE